MNNSAHKTISKCVVCDKKFIKVNTQHKYCSYHCRDGIRSHNSHNYKGRRLNREIITKCLNCKKQIINVGINGTYKHKQRYCSKACREKMRKIKRKIYDMSSKSRLMNYKAQTYKQWKNKPEEFLKLRYNQTLTKLDIIDRIIGERRNE